MYAVDYDPASGFSLAWDFEVAGQLGWVPPAIGANGGLYFGTSSPFPQIEPIQWFAPDEVPAERSPLFYAVFE